MREPIGLYVHIPFCLGKCPYCDFYSLPFEAGLADRYVEAVVRAIETQPFGPMEADSLYLGGGTPSLLGAERVGRILAAARAAFGLGGAEITLEANPGSIPSGEFEALAALGVNRVSLGVQSLDGGELAALGRRHTPRQAREAILAAKAAGFAHISADLMLAVPGQTGESLARSVDGLAGLPVDHISAYLLGIEEGTPFWAQKNALSLPDEDAAATLYLDAVRRLEGHGFAQYEISNFAREGGRSRHNLKYWRCREYLGLGPAAHSFLGGRRFYFPRDLSAFLAAPRPLEIRVEDGPGGSVEERAMLALRLTEGLSLPPDLPGGEQVLALARRLEGEGLCRVAGRTVALTPRGFLLSNSITAALLAQWTMER